AVDRDEHCPVSGVAFDRTSPVLVEEALAPEAGGLKHRLRVARVHRRLDVGLEQTVVRPARTFGSMKVLQRSSNGDAAHLRCIRALENGAQTGVSRPHRVVGTLKLDLVTLGFVEE